MKHYQITRRNKSSNDVYAEISPEVKRWTWLANRTSYNASVRDFVRGRNGVYAIRDKDSHDVLYVGESHTGRLWKTMLRHFQGQRTFEGIGEWTHPDHAQVQVQLYLTTSGADAQDLELVIVSRLAPIEVRGMYATVWGDDVPPDDDEDPVPF